MAGFLKKLASSLTSKDEDEGSKKSQQGAGKASFELPDAAVDQIDKMAGKLGISGSMVHQGLGMLGIKSKSPTPPAQAAHEGGHQGSSAGHHASEVESSHKPQQQHGACQGGPPQPYGRPSQGEASGADAEGFTPVCHKPPQHQGEGQQSHAGVDIMVRDEEVEDFGKAAARIWDLDVNRLVPGQDYAINTAGGKTSYSKADMGEDPLFSYVRPEVFKKPTFRAFQALLDNYDAMLHVSEVVTAEENAEMTAFIDSAMQQPCLRYVHKLLAAKRLAPTDELGFKKLLWKLWFELYGRGGGRGSSSGFEHVFVGEIKEGQVTGFHNWIQFYLLEKQKLVDYKGYIFPRSRGAPKPDADTQLLTIQFSWNGQLKAVGSTFVGVSPEFELALYTFCFLAGGENNRVTLGGYPVNIKCYNQNGRIGTAYPEADG